MPVLFLLSIIEMSFLPSFAILGKINLVFLAIFLFSFFENPRKWFGILVGAVGGITLDFFSDFYFGAFSIALLLICLITKKITGYFKSSNILAFIISFCLSFVAWQTAPAVFDLLMQIAVEQNLSLSLALKISTWPLAFLINFISATLAFLLLRSFKTESIESILER